MTQLCRGILVLAILAGQPPSQNVPTDLKPQLAAPASEMRLVVTRYQADRVTLAGDYA